MDDSNIIPKEELLARRRQRGDRYPDGRKVPPWRTYSPPAVYAREPRVVCIRSQTQLHAEGVTRVDCRESDSIVTYPHDDT